MNESERAELEQYVQHLTDALAALPADHPDRWRLKARLADARARLGQRKSRRRKYRPSPKRRDQDTAPFAVQRQVPGGAPGLGKRK